MNASPASSLCVEQEAFAEGMITEKISVDYEFPVYFTERLFEPENTALVSAIARREPQRRHRVLAVTERRLTEIDPRLCRTIERYVSSHASKLVLAGAPVVLPGGEEMKRDQGAVRGLVAMLERQGLDRQSVLLAIGGGALQDVVAFAAAVNQRGARVVRAPTTVLSQADSGVGVKNGINAFGKKNLLGTFAPPFAVLNDFGFLATLEPRDVRSGIAEAVKVALVRDAGFFGWIAANARPLARGEPRALRRLVRRCAELHLSHIASGGDPFELASRRPLDFAHWVAHELESLTGHRLRHGEAVAIGMAVDALYSAELGLLEPRTAETLLEVLGELGLRAFDRGLLACNASGRRRILEGIAELREHAGGEQGITLLGGIGRPLEVSRIDGARVLSVIARLERHDRERSARGSAAVCPGPEVRQRPFQIAGRVG